jgi:hypothetical protein
MHPAKYVQQNFIGFNYFEKPGKSVPSGPATSNQGDHLFLCSSCPTELAFKPLKFNQIRPHLGF